MEENADEMFVKVLKTRLEMWLRRQELRPGLGFDPSTEKNKLLKTRH